MRRSASSSPVQGRRVGAPAAAVVVLAELIAVA
jgi:hypothetical protein